MMPQATVEVDIETTDIMVFSVNAICKEMDEAPAGSGSLDPPDPIPDPPVTIHTYSGTFDLYCDAGDVIYAEVDVEYSRSAVGTSAPATTPQCGPPPPPPGPPLPDMRSPGKPPKKKKSRGKKKPKKRSPRKKSAVAKKTSSPKPAA